MISTENKVPVVEREKSVPGPSVPAALGLATALLFTQFSASAQQPGGSDGPSGAADVVALVRQAEKAPLTEEGLRSGATAVASRVIGLGTNTPTALQLARVKLDVDDLVKQMYRDLPETKSVRPDRPLPAPVNELPSELRLAVSLDVLQTRLRNAQAVMDEGLKPAIEIHPDRLLDKGGPGAVLSNPEQDRQKRLGIYWSQSLAAANKVVTRAADTSPPFARK